MEVRRRLRELFERIARTYPELRDFILEDCLPSEGGSPFDVSPSDERTPWFPYLKVSSGSDHEVSGEFFYTRPAWDGSGDGIKYRYLGREIEALVVGRARYRVDYDEARKKVVARFVPEDAPLPENCRRYLIRVVYLAVSVPGLNTGVVVLEGLRTKTNLVSSIWNAVRNSPVRVKLRTKKESSKRGVYWGMVLSGIEEASWDEFPFREFVKDLKEYFELCHELRKESLKVKVEEEEPLEEEEFPL